MQVPTYTTLHKNKKIKPPLTKQRNFPLFPLKFTSFVRRFQFAQKGELCVGVIHFLGHYVCANVLSTVCSLLDLCTLSFDCYVKVL